jgi:hypothetical protein
MVEERPDRAASCVYQSLLNRIKLPVVRVAIPPSSLEDINYRWILTHIPTESGSCAMRFTSTQQ